MTDDPQRHADGATVAPFSGEGVYFRAELTPHRSLGPTGFLILMGAIGLVSFAAGLYFWSIGAAPIMGFFGLDFLLIYIGFKLNYRAGRILETLEIRDGILRVVRRDPRGRETRWETNAYWARVGVVEAPNKPTIMQLTSHGKSHQFGDFLGEEEKFEFAGELRRVLEAYRLGEPDLAQA